MEEPSDEDRVWNLTEREISIAWLKIRNFSKSQIAEYLHISSKTVDTHITNMYNKLALSSLNDLDKESELQRRYSHIISTILPDEDALNSFNARKRAYFASRPTSPQAPSGTPPPEPQVPEPEIIEPPPAPQIARTRDQGEPGRIPNIPWIVAVLVVIIALCTCLSITNLPSLFSSMQPAPTSNSNPTATLNFTPTANLNPNPKSLAKSVPLPFTDEFNGPLSSQWIYTGTAPTTVNGSLVTTDTSWLFVGNDSWSNYQIEFLAHYDCATNGFLVVRFKELDHMLAMMYGCESLWYIIDNGIWVEVPNSKNSYCQSQEDNNRYLVDVSGNHITSYCNDQRFADLYIPDNLTSSFAKGGVGLKIINPNTLDYFRINPLP